MSDILVIPPTEDIESNSASASYLQRARRGLSNLLLSTNAIKTKISTKHIDTNNIEVNNPDSEIKNNENIKIDEVREIIYSSIESSFNSPKKIFIL